MEKRKSLRRAQFDPGRVVALLTLDFRLCLRRPKPECHGVVPENPIQSDSRVTENQRIIK
jgi:hypothetical protein